MTNENLVTRFRSFLRVPYQYRCFFHGRPRAFDFTSGIWVTTDKVKSTVKYQNTLHVENTVYRALHKKNDASLTEHPKFKNK